MDNKWSDEKAAEFVERYGPRWGDDLALCTYLGTLVGSESRLVLHGGGNMSVKSSRANIFGESIPIIFVKASGFNMASMAPDGYTALNLEYLKKLRALPRISDEDMVNEFQTHLCNVHSSAPSIETLAHAFIPKKFIEHTHADAVLALTNQREGEALVREALGSDVLILEYMTPGFKLAQAAAAAYEKNPGCKAMVWMRHGLLSWGDTARETYETTIALATRAEEYVVRHGRRPLIVQVPTPLETAQKHFVEIAPIVRGMLARPTGDPDRPYERTILQFLASREVLDFVDSDRGKEIALTPPLTGDHLIRTKALPLWIDRPDYGNVDKLKAQLESGIRDYAAAYDAYMERYVSRMPKGVTRFDSLPRVLLMPGLGAICSGKNVCVSGIVRDIAAHTLSVKAQIATMGAYDGIEERDLFDTEYRLLQHAKLHEDKELPLSRQVALVTGAAGAIGSGICQALLEQGCHVAATDLPGENLTSLVRELSADFGPRILGVPLDVTNSRSVAAAFDSISRTWGGVDLVVVNAGTALVSSIEDIDLEAFRRLERVNTEGALLVLAAAGRHFRIQGTGGDIVLVSTENVFAPGAKFGAYSATKCGAHQLARIASLEMGPIDVRVNMVAPDAVFSSGSRKSGLWTEVGPDRMRSRGLMAEELEEHYRNRNVLKARITARHVANAILFFATRQTPTTGATIPVDGGLPDATPR
jgi:rhamnose utilization protein RhaD (predicted bifunctional aldolase and dehydrogenase)/NAD(P)-dependent dehydrogenase (short-subunit alcohol dehydrogenase family)